MADKPGGITKFNPERAAKIIALVADGNYLETAARASGIDKVTLHMWIRKGRNNLTPEYAAFAEAIAMARGTAEVAAISVVRTAAESGQWQAAAWFVERSAPSRWGRQDRVALESAVKDGLEQNLDLLRQKLSPEEYERVLTALADDGDSEEATAGIEAVGH